MAATLLCRNLILTFPCFLLSLANLGFAFPIIPYTRDRSAITTNNATGSIIVFNSQTQQPIPQGSASDGGGSAFNPPAVLWVVAAFSLGVPLSLAGFRGWKFTLGTAIGLSAAVCTWAALINTESSRGFPDIAIEGIVSIFFIVGFGIGLFEFGRIPGIACLGVVGGLAIGMRIVMFKSGLLFRQLFANWLVVAGCGVCGLLLMVITQRIGIMFCTSSTGTFFFGLGVDLMINQQKGMSRGLRFLFDQNTSHVVDIISNGYTPPPSTKIIMGASLALIPILTFIQYKVFREPFERRPPEDVEIDFDPSLFTTKWQTMRKSMNFPKKLASRFSM